MEPDEVTPENAVGFASEADPDAMEEVEVDALEEAEDDLAVEEELAEEEASVPDLEFVPLHSDVEVDPQALEEESERVREPRQKRCVRPPQTALSRLLSRPWQAKQWGKMPR